MEGLQSIWCADCPLLFGMPVIATLESLTVLNCPSVTTIVTANENLRRLVLHDFPTLQELPNIQSLAEISLYACPRLKKIPHLVNLEYLACYECPSLERIPDIFSLQALRCSDCRLLVAIPEWHAQMETYFAKTPWLEHPSNPTFPARLEKLLRVQRWYRHKRRIRKMLTYGSLYRTVPQLPGVVLELITQY